MSLKNIVRAFFIFRGKREERHPFLRPQIYQFNQVYHQISSTKKNKKKKNNTFEKDLESLYSKNEEDRKSQFNDHNANSISGSAILQIFTKNLEYLSA